MDDLPDGEIVNGSYSTCAPHVEASVCRILRYDAEFRGMLLFGSAFVVLNVVLATSAVIAYSHGHWIWGTILVALPVLLHRQVLSLIVHLPMACRMIRTFYANALLTPAEIISIAPIRLFCYANIGNGGDVVHAAKIIEMCDLPLHELTIGSVVPCVSVFESGDIDGRWADFTPRPISWGTADRGEVQRCMAKIDQEDLRELARIRAAKAVGDMRTNELFVEEPAESEPDAADPNLPSDPPPPPSGR